MMNWLIRVFFLSCILFFEKNRLFNRYYISIDNVVNQSMIYESGWLCNQPYRLFNKFHRHVRICCLSLRFPVIIFQNHGYRQIDCGFYFQESLFLLKLRISLLTIWKMNLMHSTIFEMSNLPWKCDIRILKYLRDRNRKGTWQ